MHADITSLDDQYEAVEADTRAVVAALTEERGSWRAMADSWSVAECLDHLAATNRVYLQPMRTAAIRAHDRGRQRRGPATPGMIGRWFANTFEPPPKPRSKFKAPAAIRPRTGPALADATASFLATHAEVRAFLRSYADLDLAGVTFPNPFVPLVRFSLATALHVIAAHERRHLWQARRVREAAERAAITPS